MKNNEINEKSALSKMAVSVSVTDLRIGNLVKLNNKDFHAFEDFYPMSNDNNIWTIEIIFRDGSITMYNDLENLWKSCEISDIENIELNDKWLLKCGFSKSEKEWDYLIREYDIEYKINIGFKDISIHISEKYGYIKGSTHPKTKTVHQLQNLYHALTGSDLQISYLTEH